MTTMKLQNFVQGFKGLSDAIFGRVNQSSNPPQTEAENEVSSAQDALYAKANNRETTKYAEGDVLAGYVSGVKHYGLFVRLPNGESGLVFNNEINWPGDDAQYHEGSQVKVVVRGFKPGLGLSLSIRWAAISDTYKHFNAFNSVGSVVPGRIKRIMDYGVFVSLTPGVSGLIHRSKLENFEDYSSKNLGEKVAVKIVSIEPDSRRIQLDLSS
jgi:small subunit ribosomal protein S1